MSLGRHVTIVRLNEDAEVRVTLAGKRLVYVVEWTTMSEALDDMIERYADGQSIRALARVDELLAWCGATWVTEPDVNYATHATFLARRVLTRVTGYIECLERDA